MRFCILISAFCILSSSVSAVEPGPSTPLRSSFDPKEVVRQVRRARSEPAAASCEPFALDDGEFLIDTSTVPGLASSAQCAPAIAFDGTNYLVVWYDYRSGDSFEIYGARVSQAGVVLDPYGIAISTAAYDEEPPALAFDGTNYLVAWVDERSGNYYIYGARVSQAGVVLDPNGVTISTSTDYKESPALAFDGTNYLAVWPESRGGGNSRIYGARVNQAGVVLDTNGIAISTATNGQVSPALTFDGTNYLVVWQDGRGHVNIYGARVNQAGVVLDPDGIAISTSTHYQESPAIAFDGTNYLVAWTDERSGDYSVIYGARVSQAGVVLDPDGIAISTATDGQLSPALAFDGTNYLVAWVDWRGNYADIYGARVSQAGVVLDPNGIAISTATGHHWSPALAFDGTNYLVVCEEEGNGLCGICGARVNQAGVVLDPDGIVVSNAACGQLSPALAFDGTNYLVVWTDGRGHISIYGARVSQAGVLLDPKGIAISTAGKGQGSPALAFDGTNYLVVWHDDRSGSGYLDIYGARVNQAGVVLDPDGIAISTASAGQWSPALAFDGTNYLVAWLDERDSVIPNIYGARVNQAGVVLDPNGIAISTATYNKWSPALAFDGTNYLVVWYDDRGSVSIYGARVNQAGVVLDPDGIVITTTRNCMSPALAFDGTNYLVVWDDYRSGGSYDIYGARVNQAGVVLDPDGIAISNAGDWQWSPVLAFDGTNYLVVWCDNRGGSYDIYGARVTPAGTVYDEGPVVRQEGGQFSPALVRGSGSSTFLVYQGWAGVVGGKTYNTERIWGKLNPSPGIEESRQPTACGSRPAATIIRGVLSLEVDSRQHTAYRAELLDITGRRMLDLVAGANDVSSLAPGVYFCRQAAGFASCDRAAGAGRATKVVLTR